MHKNRRLQSPQFSLKCQKSFPNFVQIKKVRKERAGNVAENCSNKNRVKGVDYKFFVGKENVEFALPLERFLFAFRVLCFSLIFVSLNVKAGSVNLNIYFGTMLLMKIDQFL
jgi:hypothetical protein